MITSAFLNLIYTIVRGLLTAVAFVLPTASLPADFTDALAQVGSYLRPMNAIVPMDTLLAIVVLMMTVELAIFTFRSVMWVIKRFPTQS